MADQAYQWSQAAARYEEEYIDPYRPDVKNPLPRVLARLADRGKTAADLGCGIGPLLPSLAEQFGKVYAVDFAEGMLARARERCRGVTNVTFVETSLTNLKALAGRIDVAVAVNSLVMPDVGQADESLKQIRGCLRDGGVFLAIVPAMDAVHYYTMLLVERALAAGKPHEAARRNAAYHGEHVCFDFAFGQYRYNGLEQHFWQPFEIRHRWRKAGFDHVRLGRVWLSWKQFHCAEDLRRHRPPWDWFVYAR
jgi:ubiquinone/menaquinone biosynthesis C-methylase UbiE